MGLGIIEINMPVQGVDQEIESCHYQREVENSKRQFHTQHLGPLKGTEKHRLLLAFGAPSHKENIQQGHLKLRLQ